MAESCISILKLLIMMKRKEIQRGIDQIEHAPQLTEKLKEMQKDIHRLKKENEELQQNRKSTERVNYSHAFNEKKLKKIEKELANTKQELDDANNRLSQLMGRKLTDNNPAIADLNDVNRPQNLGQRYSELYDNQWTDAFGSLQKDPSFEDERQIFDMLLNVLVKAMDFCKRNAEFHKRHITNTLLMRDDEKYRSELGSENARYARYALLITPYLQECFSICWLMCVQDPPVVFGSLPKHGAAFDKNAYKEFTQSGTNIDFVVWPAMFLFQGGNVLCKGVAQGKKTYTPGNSSSKSAWSSSPEDLKYDSYARKHEDKIRSRDTRSAGTSKTPAYGSHTTKGEDNIRSRNTPDFQSTTMHSSRSYDWRNRYSDARIPQYILDNFEMWSRIYPANDRKLMEAMGRDNYFRCVEYFKQKGYF
ncbi:uncharacterized protein LOC127854019 isoform X2 [Dreissena polymorpha]|uniref:uncharacterized protein LOC127854019 isoform X2 n=1 Tax=Dreissena polymorpha TaxID=45954 RepID=UPI0022640C5D|nr:uncharacterized protein LOC127854019 isoform X2 [Dreissena polymorpha]